MPRFSALISVVAAVSFGCGKPSPSDTQTPTTPAPMAQTSSPATTPDTPLGEPVATMLVTSLHSEYARNQISADEKYAGKTVVIYAIANEVEKREEGPAAKCRNHGSFLDPQPVCAIAYLSQAGVDYVKTTKIGMAKITGRVVGRVNSSARDVDNGMYIKLDQCLIETVNEIPKSLYGDNSQKPKKRK